MAGWGNEQSKEGGRKWPSQWPRSHEIPVWTQENPAFSVGAHFRYQPLQTSHLTSNLICQHSHFLSYLALMQLGWYCNMVLDTARVKIQGRQSPARHRQAGQRHGGWTNQYSRVSALSRGRRWEQSACLIPSPSPQTHTRDDEIKHKLEKGGEGEGGRSLWCQTWLTQLS